MTIVIPTTVQEMLQTTMIKTSSLVAILLMLGIAYQLSQFTWFLLNPQYSLSYQALSKSAPLKKTNISTNQPKKQNQRGNYINKLNQLVIFGHIAEKVEEVIHEPIIEEIIEEAPDTSLKLTLKGVIVSDPPENSVAIIEDSKRQENFYSIGDTIPGGAIMREVHEDKVILERNGKYETLRLPENLLPQEKEQSTQKTAAPSRRVIKKKTAKINRRQSAPVKANVPKADPELTDMRDVLLNNPQKVMQLIRVRPVFESGTIKGYKVNPGKDRKMFDKVGLKAGDLILSVNGIELNDPAQGFQALSQLTTAEIIYVTIERNGQTENLSLDFGN